MEVAAFIALAGWILDNAPRVQELVTRHQSGQETLTKEKIAELIAAAQADSEQVNRDWENS